MTNENEHIVDFEKWCELCKHKDDKDINEPCNSCLDQPININSTKPINFKQK